MILTNRKIINDLPPVSSFMMQNDMLTHWPRREVEIWVRIGEKIQEVNDKNIAISSEATL